MSKDNKHVAELPIGVSRSLHWTLFVLGICFASQLSSGLALADSSGVEFSVTEKGSTRPLPCRIHVKDQAGKSQRAGSLPFWHDHFVCSGTAQVQLTPGEHTYEVERGPEYRSSSGRFKVADNAVVKVRVQLERIADLAQQRLVVGGVACPSACRGHGTTHVGGGLAHRPPDCLVEQPQRVSQAKAITPAALDPVWSESVLPPHGRRARA
jgi:hypothetical protein